MEFLSQLSAGTQIIGGLILAYILGAIMFMVFIKVHADENGDAIIDHKAWYFAVAYPYRRNSDVFINMVMLRGINICPFYAKMFFSLIFHWPVIIVVETIKFLLFNLFSVPTGKLCLPGISNSSFPGPVEFFGDVHNSLRLFRKSDRRWILAGCVYIGYYVALWLVRPRLAQALGAVALLVLMVMVAVYCLSKYIDYRDEKERSEGPSTRKSLFYEWLSAKKSKICPRLKVV